MVPLETDPTLTPSPVAPASDASHEWLGNVRAGVRARLFGDGPPADAPAQAVSDGPTRIGRYVVIKRIGAGGMGVVYAAYDDKLDRKVAVKLLRPGQGRVSPTARARLLREAQAIAKLSHSAVVQVYEVGTHRDEVFIAMEYVDGVTLKGWQRSQSWQEILQCYVAAGRGLCAAHEAGIVHRDFKADNVLVRANDGSVRVLDFGLASTDDRPSPNADTPPPPASDSDAASLTHTGMIMGTPAYMAPEQHRAGATDARTDQFSFCASLYEALYGYRPFGGESLDALRTNVLEGNVEPAPRYTQVPPPIFKALRRGLSVAPEDRFATMDGLLTELRLPTSRLPWRRAGLGVVAVAAVAVAVGWSNAEARQVAIEAARVRVQFENTRMADAEDELRRVRQRTVAQRWDDLVLAYARAHLDDSSTDVLAALKHLSPNERAWLTAARSVAADASRRGPTFASLRVDAPVRRIDFAPRGATLAALVGSEQLVWWDDGGQPRPLPIAFDSPIADIAMGGEGTVWVATQDGRVSSLRSDGSSRASWRVDTGPLRTIAVSPDDEQIAVGTVAGEITLVSPKGEITQTLLDDPGALTRLRFDPAAPVLASGSETGVVQMWFLDRATHRTLEVDGPVLDLQWPSDRRSLLASTGSGLWTWSATDGTAIASAFRPETHAAAVGARTPGALERRSDGLHWVLDSESSVRLDRGDDATVLALAPDGAWAAAGSADTLRIWNDAGDATGHRASGERRVPLEVDRGVVALHARDEFLYGFGPDGAVIRITPDDHVERLASLPISVRTAQPDPSGRRVAIEDTDGAIHLLDLDDPSGFRSLGHRARPTPGLFAWAADGSLIAKQGCAPDFHACWVLALPLDGAPPIELGSIDQAPIAIRISPRGETIATALLHGILLWSVDDRSRSRPTLPSPPAGLGRRRLGFAFHRDGPLRIATVDRPLDDDETHLGGTTLRIWHATPGSERVHELFSESNLQLLRATESGAGLALITADGRTLLWTLGNDRIRLLPDDTFDVQAPPDQIHVSPDGSQLWMVPEVGNHTFVLDIDTGQRQRLPHLVPPVAWPTDGSIVDVVHLRYLRRWDSPAPDDPAGFLRWLESRTRLELPADALR